MPKIVRGVTFRDGMKSRATKCPPLDLRRHPNSRIAPDQRVLEFAEREPVFGVYLKAFRSEFGIQFQPTIGLAHEDARKTVFTVSAFGGFRDAVCMSAVITGQTRTLQGGHPQGVLFSDAFDVYPWFPSTEWNGHVVALTPALKALHSLNELRPQSAPALGKRSLSPHH